jgi:uncharacterized membrane protein
MGKSRLLYLVLCFTLVLTLVGIIGASAVSAQDQTATPTPTASPTPTPPVPELKLKCDVPTYFDNSGATFNFSVNLTYSGGDTIVASLSPTNPTGWKSTITFGGKEVSSVPIGPYQLYSNTYEPDSKNLNIALSPNSGVLPDPGEYKMTLKASSGQFVQTIDLTAVVKAKYQFSMTTDSGKLSTTATSGKENHFSFNMNNTGTAALDNISLSVTKPDNWTVTFNPDKVASIGPNQTQQEDVIIKPPSGKTVAGDYIITLKASNENVNSSMDVRVTVETSSIWGVVSIGIIVLVIAGLAVLFLRLGRR